MPLAVRPSFPGVTPVSPAGFALPPPLPFERLYPRPRTRYSWACALVVDAVNEDLCFTTSDNTVLDTSQYLLTVSGSGPGAVIQIPGGLLAPGEYRFSVQVEAGAPGALAPNQLR